MARDPRHSNDNVPTETKNGAVVRKLFGYAHIPLPQTARFNTLCHDTLKPIVNFYRPAFSPESSHTRKSP